MIGRKIYPNLATSYKMKIFFKNKHPSIFLATWLNHCIDRHLGICLWCDKHGNYKRFWGIFSKFSVGTRSSNWVQENGSGGEI